MEMREKTKIMRKTRVLLVPNKAMWYRMPLFLGLSKLYDIKFLFTQEKGNIAKNVKELNELNYEILPNLKLFPQPYPQNVSLNVLLKLIKDKDNYDIVIWGDNLLFEGWVSFFISKLLRKPFILWSDSWDWPGHRSSLNRIVLPLINFVKKHSNACVVHGIKHKEHFISLGTPSDKIFVVGSVSIVNEESKDIIQKETIREKLGLRNKKIILFVGRLIKRKGAQYLIKAFSKLKEYRDDISLIIIGDGDCKKELQILCENLGMEKDVHFLGWIKNERLAPYYSLCNVFVLPASAEPWGLVLNEAMSLGKPVISTTGVGAAYDLIKDGVNGFTVPEKDVDALYNAMKKIISDPELEKKMGKKSKRIIEEGFRYEHMVDGFREAIAHVLKEAVK